MNSSTDEIKSAVRHELHSFFSLNGRDDKRALDVSRIPFICNDIKEIKKDVSFLKKIIFGAIGLILVSWMTHFLGL